MAIRNAGKDEEVEGLLAGGDGEWHSLSCKNRITQLTSIYHRAHQVCPQCLLKEDEKLCPDKKNYTQMFTVLY